jgi:hypothetical protein
MKARAPLQMHLHAGAGCVFDPAILPKQGPLYDPLTQPKLRESHVLSGA